MAPFLLLQVLDSFHVSMFKVMVPVAFDSAEVMGKIESRSRAERIGRRTLPAAPWNTLDAARHLIVR